MLGVLYMMKNHSEKQCADCKVVETVAVNERGLRIGEKHPRAKLSDEDVDLIHQLIDDADADKAAGRPYLKDCEIAAKFEISKAHVHNLRYDKDRAQTPERFKEVVHLAK